MEREHLNIDDWDKLNRMFIDHLNSFEDDSELKIDEDYFFDHEVHADLTFMGMYRFLMVEMIPDDEGGSSMLYIHSDAKDIERIEFAAWTFDTATVVWKADESQSHSFDTGGWNEGNHPGGEASA